MEILELGNDHVKGLVDSLELLDQLLRSRTVLKFDELGQTLVCFGLEAETSVYLVLAVAYHDQVDDLLRLQKTLDLPKVGKGRLFPLVYHTRKPWFKQTAS